MTRTAATVLIALLLVAGCGQAPPPGPSVSGSAAVAASSASAAAIPSPPATPSPSPSPSATPPTGGPIVERAIARFAAEPFRTAFEQRTESTTKTDRITATADTTLTGRFNGADVTMHIGGTLGGVTTDTDIVVVGERAYARANDGPWQEAQRSLLALSLEALLIVIRPALTSEQLADLGVETLDGKPVHHLVAVRPIPYEASSGDSGVFDRLDLWIADDGTPVRMTSSFSSAKGVLSSIGTSDVRFTEFGRAVAIKVPALPASPTPRPRP